MLKRLVIITLAVLCASIQVGAQSIDSVLKALKTKPVKLGFELYEYGVPGVVARGSVTTSGGAYLLDLKGGIKVYNNGTDKYTVDENDQEVIIEKKQPLDEVSSVLNGENLRVEGESAIFTWTDGKTYLLDIKSMDVVPGLDSAIFTPAEFSKDYIITDLR